MSIYEALEEAARDARAMRDGRRVPGRAVSVLDEGLRRQLGEALGWDGNQLRDVEPIVARAIEEAAAAAATKARRRRGGPCGCAWCCARTPFNERGDMHKRTCRP